jgi:membrane protein DedA with SNARE-associated domain
MQNFFMNKLNIMIKKIFQKIIHLLNILLIWLSIILALISIFKKEWIEAFIEWMRVLIEGLWFWNYVIAWFSSFIEAFPVLWVVVPWQNILLIVWWFFWNISYVNLAYIVLIATIWAILWNYVWYLLWKHFGDSFFKKYGLWFGIGLTEVKYLKEWIHKWWPWWIIVWKFHPMTRAFLPFIAWSMGMNSKKFMIYNIIGSCIRASIIILLGVIFADYYKVIIEHFWKIMLLILWAVWIYIYKYKQDEFKKYMVEKNKEMEELYGEKNK